MIVGTIAPIAAKGEMAIFAKCGSEDRLSGVWREPSRKTYVTTLESELIVCVRSVLGGLHHEYSLGARTGLIEYLRCPA
jgi:hypothetical protein